MCIDFLKKKSIISKIYIFTLCALKNLSTCCFSIKFNERGILCSTERVMPYAKKMYIHTPCNKNMTSEVHIIRF